MILIKKLNILLFIFIFIISTSSYGQDSQYYWKDIGKSLHQVLDKMGVPDDIEYQLKINSYLLAYDFGDIAIIYVIKENFVSNIIYMETSFYDDIMAQAYMRQYNFSKENGFEMLESGVGYFVGSKEKILLTGNISKIDGEFVLTILVSKKD